MRLPELFKMTSTTTGTGTITLGAAVSGFMGVGQLADGDVVKYTIKDANGTNVEVGIGTYTASGTTLSRTRILRSVIAGVEGTTPLTLSAGTHTVLIGQTGYDAKNQLVSVAGADADTTMEVGTLYNVDMSAWATANRTYTLPSVFEVDDRVAIKVTAGSATLELVYTAASGDTCEGVAGGTEVSRLFITGETIVFRATAANSAWAIEHDGRKPQVGLMSLTTATGSTEVAATSTRPTQAPTTPGAWTAVVNVGSVCGITTDRMTVRRAGNYNVAYSAVSITAVATAKYFGASLTLNNTSTTALLVRKNEAITAISRVFENCPCMTLAADDYLLYQFISEEGGAGLANGVSPRLTTYFGIREILG